MNRVCPNCGADMEYYRTERQATGDREVEMRWHLSLVDWRSTSLRDTALPDEGYTQRSCCSGASRVFGEGDTSSGVRGASVAPRVRLLMYRIARSRAASTACFPSTLWPRLFDSGPHFRPFYEMRGG